MLVKKIQRETENLRHWEPSREALELSAPSKTGRLKLTKLQGRNSLCSLLKVGELGVVKGPDKIMAAVAWVLHPPRMHPAPSHSTGQQWLGMG